MTSTAGVTYTYDGDGRRASKSSGKLYWYGSGGEILAETDALGNTTAEYIFFGGKRIAMLPADSSAQFYAKDFLGSSRVVTSNTGVVCYDADFYPYGGERTVTNTCTQNNYKFEGKERDAESGLDYFGARFDSSSLGRLMSPDPNNAGALDGDPQTWNAYAYVRNNPLNLIDPTGLNLLPLNGCDHSAEAGCKDPCGDDPSKCTVSADPPPQLPTSSARFVIGERVGQAAQKANDYLHAAYQAVVNSRVACTAAYTAAGALAGGVVGAETGGAAGAGGGALVGLAGGPAAPVTVPLEAGAGGGLGAIVGGVGGALGGGALGLATGQALCSSGTGSGGGGGGGRTSPNQMNQQVQRGQAPDSIDRVDSPRFPHEKPHIEFKVATR